MLLGGSALVVDAVVHAFDMRKENARAGRYAELGLEGFYRFFWEMMDEPYRLSAGVYQHDWTAEELGSALFHESRTDIAVYHPIPAWGIFHDLSPARNGFALRELYPGRVFMYGAVSPLEGSKAIADLEEQAETWGIIGLKLYPVDSIQGQIHGWSMSDERIAYPIFEKCLDLGIKTVAVHKALPLATSPMDPFRPGDIDYAAADFPSLNFEVVHGGAAFLDETALQLGRFANVYVNLEGTSQLLVKHPHMFARILGEILMHGGRKRLLWGTGTMAFHPAPILEAFERFSLTEGGLKGYGYPELDDDTKADILGLNYLRMHGLSRDEVCATIADDLITDPAAVVPPWQGLEAVT
jgi:predicted TIM-barrel fold metal-dependent hydrolase